MTHSERLDIHIGGLQYLTRMEGWNKRTYRKISNISLPECKPPKNKAKGEFQVQLLNLSKTGIYVNSNRIKRYYDGFR